MRGNVTRGKRKSERVWVETELTYPLVLSAHFPSRRSSRARLAVAAVLALVPTSGNALSPLSPQLDQASRLALVKALSKHGISEVASSAVLVSLLAVLGPEPAARQYQYREPYPHLPNVDADASVADPACVRIHLTAWPKPGQPVILRGTYCLTDQAAYTWSARGIVLEDQ